MPDDDYPNPLTAERIVNAMAEDRDALAALVNIMPNVMVFDEDGPHVIIKSADVELTAINAVMAAARGAFDPREERGLSAKQLCDAACALVEFLKFVETAPVTRTIGEWRRAIENLHLRLGPKGDSRG